MFFHIYITRIKCLVRDRQMLFWTLFFPIMLATLFGLAFSNLSKANLFEKVNIAVVDNAEYKADTALKSTLESVSKPKSGETQLFSITYATKEKAEDLLNNSKIAGYIEMNNGLKVIVKSSGFSQTVLRQFMDNYLQTGSAVKTIIKEKPAAMQTVMKNTGDSKDYLREVSSTGAKPDDTLIYYYALIGMTCLYGGFWGMQEVTAVQANLSPQGARVNLAPVHKLKVFASSICAASSVQFLSVLLLICYLVFVIKVDFGAKIGYILLACAAGSFCGVSMGSMIGAAVKASYNIKIAIEIAVSMLCSFLSGLMVADMKYIVTNALPFMSYINPGNLIVDAFYALYYYSTNTRYFINVGLLFAFTVLFYFVTYLTLRRQRYASI